MSLAQVEEHQKRHGFSTGAMRTAEAPVAAQKVQSRMNGGEARYSLILEAMKRRGEIIEWRFEGVKLAWGVDPTTGKPMYYTPDFYVTRRATFEDSERLLVALPITLIEIKGPFIHPKDLIRFKGCRSDWPMFRFEMHQCVKGAWTQIL